MSSNANGKRPVGSEDRSESANTKRARVNTTSFSPEFVQKQPAAPDHTANARAQTTDPFPAVNPDLGFDSFLDKYLATHSADDSLFRDAITKLVEARLDFTGIKFADTIMEDVKDKGGNHPDTRAVQKIVDQEVCYKLARMLMSAAQGTGHLPVTMRYLGQIAADTNGVHVSERFDATVQNFLADVGRLPIAEATASAERQMSVLNVDDDMEEPPVKEEHREPDVVEDTGSGNRDDSSEDSDSEVEEELGDGDDSDDEDNGNKQINAGNSSDADNRRSTPPPPCERWVKCKCIANQSAHFLKDRRVKMSRGMKKELPNSTTPLVTRILGTNVVISNELKVISRQRNSTLAFLQSRAQAMPAHRLKVSQLPGFDRPDAWTNALVHAFLTPIDEKRIAVETVLFQFVNANRCLFPELRSVKIRKPSYLHPNIDLGDRQQR